MIDRKTAIRMMELREELADVRKQLDPFDAGIITASAAGIDTVLSMNNHTDLASFSLEDDDTA